MIGHKCVDSIVYPEGLNGERICRICGLVMDDSPALPGYSCWSPEWYSNWSENDSETLMEWLTVLRSVSCQLNIPNFPYREEAARIIRKQNRHLFTSQRLSKNKRATVAALMHLVLKRYDKMRSLKEISRDLSIDSTALMKQTWLVNKTLSFKQVSFAAKRKTAIDYLHEYGGGLATDPKLIITAQEMLAKVRRSGGNPIGLAAGAFYNSCKEKKFNISRERVGEAFHVSHRTVYTNEVKIKRLLNDRFN